MQDEESVAIEEQTLPCQCESCQEMYRYFEQANQYIEQQRQHMTARVIREDETPKWAVYTIGRIIELFRSLIDIEHPDKMTTFMRIYDSWVKAESRRLHPGHM